MRAAAKQRFRQSRPSSCVYCGIWIKCDMYRHVARFHLDLAQLWRCTVWKGTPNDCMDHVRGAHDVPWDVKSASLEQFLPQGTVRRQVWSDSMKPQHSGISTDILLFSDINLSLVHHFTRSTSVSFLMSPSGRAICHSSVHCCRCQWLSLWMECCRQPRLARDRYVRLVLRSLWESRSERPDVPIDGCDRCVWWGHRLGIFRSSHFRILRTSRGWWSSTVGLRCSRCLWI